MTSNFEKLKDALCQDVLIHTPDFDKPFILQTDASESAVGAVLMQEDTGVERPVVYASHKLHPAETQYATIEREGLTIQWAIEHFHYYVMGQEFKLAMDHAPLQWLSHAKTSNAQIMRWTLTFTAF